MGVHQRIGLVVLTALPLGVSACTAPPDAELEAQSEWVAIRIDPGLRLSDEEVEARRLVVGRDQRLGVAQLDTQDPLLFYEGELIVEAGSEEELAELLQRYGAKVLRDGNRPAPPPDLPWEPRRSGSGSSGNYLIKLDLARVDLGSEGFATALARLGHRGEVVFGSQGAAATYWVYARERARGLRVELDHAGQLNVPDCPQLSTQDHPYSTSAPDPSQSNEGYSDAYGDPTYSDPELQVTRAWAYTGLLGRADRTVPIAVIDLWYHLNEDYRGYPSVWGYDFRDGEYHEGVLTDHEWPHGAMVSSIATAVPDNRFGVAGVGGQVGVPLWFRVGNLHSFIQAIYTSVDWGAEVISISMFYCSKGGSKLQDAIDYANQNGVVVVVSAGNEGKDLDKITRLPAKSPGVITVGGVVPSTRRAFRKADGYKWGSNFGSHVDLWAPATELWITPIPFYDNEAVLFEKPVAGTSLSSPFVAGIVAMMKAARPSLDHAEALGLLQATSRPSSDPLGVTGEIVDAFGALEATAKLAGIAPLDPFEDNDTLFYAADVEAGEVHHGVLLPGDEDFFQCTFDDFREVEIRITTEMRSFVPKLKAQVFDGEGKALLASSLPYLTDRLRELQVTYPTPFYGGGPDRQYQLRIWSDDPEGETCYGLQFLPGAAQDLGPDDYDDEVDVFGSPDWPRNDNFADRRDLGQPTDDELLGVSRTVDSLTFDDGDDVDFFEIQLPPAIDPDTGQDECVPAGTPPHGEAGFYQGGLDLWVTAIHPGVHEDFRVKLYDASGTVVRDEVVASGSFLRVDCPNAEFPDGKLRFSIESEPGHRNVYRLKVKHWRWYQLYDLPEWLEEWEPEPPLFPIEDIDEVDPIDPLGPLIQFADLVVDPRRNPVDPVSPARAWTVMDLPGAGGVRLRVEASAGSPIEVVLRDAEGGFVASAVALPVTRGGQGLLVAGELVVPELHGGRYFVELIGGEAVPGVRLEVDVGPGSGPGRDDP